MTRISGLEEKTRYNALFLSVAAQFNQPVAKKILQWFSDFQVVMPEHDIPGRYGAVPVVNEATSLFGDKDGQG